MAVNVKTVLEIPELSDHSSCEDDDDNYFTDLQQADNKSDKLLNNLAGSAEVISEEKIKKNEQAARQITVLNATTEIKVYLYSIHIIHYMYSIMMRPFYSFTFYANVLWCIIVFIIIYLLLSFRAELTV